MEARDKEAEEDRVEAAEVDGWDIILIRHLHHPRVGHLPHTRVVYSIQLRAHIMGKVNIQFRAHIRGKVNIQYRAQESVTVAMDS